MSVFGAYARYYDLLYRDKDYAAEAAYVHGLIQQHAPGAKTILDLGCGTGAHAAQFAEMGYEVHGVDSSADMLEGANRRRASLAPDLAGRLEFTAGDVRNFRGGRHYDAVTALFHVVSYQVTDDDLANIFDTAAEHLAPGGIFLFDCWYGPAVLSDPPVVRVKRLEDTATGVVRTAEPTMRLNENITVVDYQVLVTDRVSGQTEEIRERHELRYLFAPDLGCCLEAAGMEPILLCEWMTGNELSTDTWSALVIGRKTPAAER